MARVTVEDCILNVPNRFELVIMAAHRAKQIASGTPITVERDNDKDAVVSLREIADKTIELGQLGEDMIQSHSKRHQVERIEKEVSKFQESKADDQISAVFEDASKHVVQPPVTEGEGSLSFAEENVAVED